MAEPREISMRDANQGFAQLIREVESGGEVVITRRGEAVARIVPIRGRKRTLTAEQQAAWERLETSFSQHAFDDADWKVSRDELYDDMIDERS